MLCTECGSEVGPVARLCDNCSAKQTSTLPIPEMEYEKPKPKVAPAEQSTPSASKSTAPTKKTKGKKATGGGRLYKVLLVIIAIQILLVVYFVATGRRDSSTEEPTPGPAIELPEPFQELPPVVQELPTGSISIGGNRLNLDIAHAMYLPTEHRLEVAFFHQTSEPEALEQAKKDKGFNLTLPNSPVVSVQLMIAEGTQQCSLNSLSSYTVSISRRDLINASSSLPPMVFIRSGTSAAIAEIPQFECVLQEQGDLSLHLLEPGTADPMSGTLVAWNLLAKVKIKDVAFEQVQAPVKTVAPVEAPSAPSIAENVIRAGKSEVKARSALALYHYNHDRLEVGIFGEELTKEEIAAAAGKRSLRTAIPSKSPIMIIGLRLKAKSRAIEISNIEEWFVSILRDPLGSFYFPGSRDLVSFDRPTQGPAETFEISGSLALNQQINLAIAGQDTITRPPQTEFHWNVKLSAPVLETGLE